MSAKRFFGWSGRARRKSRTAIQNRFRGLRMEALEGRAMLAPVIRITVVDGTTEEPLLDGQPAPDHGSIRITRSYDWPGSPVETYPSVIEVPLGLSDAGADIANSHDFNYGDNPLDDFGPCSWSVAPPVFCAKFTSTYDALTETWTHDDVVDVPVIADADGYYERTETAQILLLPNPPHNYIIDSNFEQANVFIEDNTYAVGIEATPNSQTASEARVGALIWAIKAVRRWEV